MMRTFLLCRLVFALTVLVAPVVQAEVYHPSTYTLANGLQIIVVPNHRAPVVNQMLWYKVGSLDEVAGKSGLAHYLEHLMFKGTHAVPPGGYSKMIAAVGGHDNAFTSFNYTAYFATVPVDFLPRLMELEADRMQNLQFDTDQTKPELAVVLAERRQRTDDNPDGRFNEKMGKAVYGDHPLGRSVIGWREEVEDLDDEDAADFYHTWYAPNNAILIISGDVTPEQVLQQAVIAFGDIKKKTMPTRQNARALYKPRSVPDVLFVQDPDVQQINIERHYTAPSYADAQGNQAYALQVLEQILDGGAVGRLYRGLVMKQKLVTESGGSYDPLSRDFGSFTIGLSLPPKGNVGKATNALDGLLAKLVKQGVTQSEVDLAIKRLREQAIFTRDHLMTPGYAFGQHLALGLTVDDVENWPDAIGRVTVADVNAVARLVFSSKDYVTGTLLPDGKQKTSGRVTKIAAPVGDIR